MYSIIMSFFVSHTRTGVSEWLNQNSWCKTSIIILNTMIICWAYWVNLNLEKQRISITSYIFLAYSCMLEEIIQIFLYALKQVLNYNAVNTTLLRSRGLQIFIYAFTRILNYNAVNATLLRSHGLWYMYLACVQCTVVLETIIIAWSSIYQKKIFAFLPFLRDCRDW